MRAVMPKLTGLDWALLAVSIPISAFIATKAQVWFVLAVEPYLRHGGPVAWLLLFLAIQVGVVGGVGLMLLSARFILRRRKPPN